MSHTTSGASHSLSHLPRRPVISAVCSIAATKSLERSGFATGFRGPGAFLAFFALGPPSKQGTWSVFGDFCARSPLKNGDLEHFWRFLLLVLLSGAEKSTMPPVSLARIERAVKTVWRFCFWQGPRRSIRERMATSSKRESVAAVLLGKRAERASGGTESAKQSGAPTLAAASRKTGAVSGSSEATRAGTPGLKIPAFSEAISALVEPSRAQ